MMERMLLVICSQSKESDKCFAETSALWRSQTPPTHSTRVEHTYHGSLSESVDTRLSILARWMFIHGRGGEDAFVPSAPDPNPTEDKERPARLRKV